ncbi:MAG: rhomboid family intramembrane serine protease [Bacteroidales bacterium]|nr:MAG: rhomboid family intramembrane serine protease [Bacteroidales bacterium]
MNNINRVINSSPAVFNIIIVNLLLLLANNLFEGRGVELNEVFGLHFVLSDNFHAYQFVTYMFMHGGIEHLFFNMFAIFMFGRVFESIWGAKKFLFYYFVAGLGAAVVQQTMWYIDYVNVVQHIADLPLAINLIAQEGYKVLGEGYNYSDEYMGMLNILWHIPTVGASGAVFGILLAFGFMFPQEKLFMFFIPIPIPARVFVIIYGVVELFAGVANFKGDNIAHFAHLGGLLFGLLLLIVWKKRGLLFSRYLS